MKYQDHQLLEEAYDKVLLKEGRDNEVELSDSEYYSAMDDANNEKYDAKYDTDDSFHDRVETDFSLDGVEFFVAADLYGSTIYVDDSFDHAFGTEESHHIEKTVEIIKNLEIHFYEEDKGVPLTPETFGLEKYKEIQKIAKDHLTEKSESE